MLERLKKIMVCLIGTSIGIYLGNILFCLFHYSKNIILYKSYSAPWYTKIVLITAIMGIILIIEIGIYGFICYKLSVDKKKG